MEFLILPASQHGGRSRVTMCHGVKRRQSLAKGPSLSSGLGRSPSTTDFVSVISAIVTPVAWRSPAAEPLTIKAYPPGSVGGQNNDTWGTRAMFLPADSPTAHPTLL